MCHICNERDKVIDSLCDQINATLEKAKEFLTREEAIALLVGTAVGVAKVGNISKEEFFSLAEDIFSAGNERLELREREQGKGGMH